VNTVNALRCLIFFSVEWFYQVGRLNSQMSELGSSHVTILIMQQVRYSLISFHTAFNSRGSRYPKAKLRWFILGSKDAYVVAFSFEELSIGCCVLSYLRS
jgi:hypothetical protein